MTRSESASGQADDLAKLAKQIRDASARAEEEEAGRFGFWLVFWLGAVAGALFWPLFAVWLLS